MSAQAQYFEEFLDMAVPDRPKGPGVRTVEDPCGRLLGYAGRKDYETTEALVLTKGHKTVTYNKAGRTMRLRTMIQRLEGRPAQPSGGTK